MIITIIISLPGEQRGPGGRGALVGRDIALGGAGRAVGDIIRPVVTDTT